MLDAAVDMRILSRLIRRINERFGLADKQIETYYGKRELAIFDLVKRTGARFVDRFITHDVLIPMLKRMGIKIVTRQGAKYVPILGTAIAAGISLRTMKALAHLHITECERIVKRLIDKDKTRRVIDIKPEEVVRESGNPGIRNEKKLTF